MVIFQLIYLLKKLILISIWNLPHVTLIIAKKVYVIARHSESREYSDVDNFDKRCNELESWLHERGYNEKMVRGEVLRARAFSRYDLLNKPPRVKKDNLLTFNISYYPQFRKIKDILKEIHIL